MIPYLFLIGIPALIAVGSTGVRLKNIKISHNTLAFFSFFFLFFLILSLRGISCGNDTRGYVHSFELASLIGWENLASSKFEIGYAFFEKLCSSILPNAQCFLAVAALASVAPIAYLYIREGKLPCLTLALFVTVAPFTMYFSGIRQVLAMAFAVPAWYCTKHKKLVFFLLTVAVAMLFHASAMVLFLLYPVYRVRITPKWLWVVIPVILLIFLFNRQVFSFLTILFGDAYGGDVASTGAYNVLLLLVLFAALAYVMPDEALLDRDTVALRNILLFSIVLQCFAPVHYLAMRMNYYYLIFIPLLIPRLLVVYRDAYQKLVSVALLVLTGFFTVYFFYNLTTGTGLHIYPYLPFWSSQ